MTPQPRADRSVLSGQVPRPTGHATESTQPDHAFIQESQDLVQDLHSAGLRLHRLLGISARGDRSSAEESEIIMEAFDHLDHVLNAVVGLGFAHRRRFARPAASGGSPSPDAADGHGHERA
jgi:hypothetical protein